jgi:hypothetical protein
VHPKNSVKINKNTLKQGQVVWSEYFKAYVSYVGRDFDEDFLFKYLNKEKYCVIIDSEIYEPPSLIKELL